MPLQLLLQQQTHRHETGAETFGTRSFFGEKGGRTRGSFFCVCAAKEGKNCSQNTFPETQKVFF